MIFHHHGNKKMRFEHADPRAKSVVKAVTPRLDPKHDPNNCEIKKEDEVWHAGVGERNCDDGGTARDGPVGGRIESRSPDHDAAQFATIKMRHGVDVALVVKTARGRGCGFSWSLILVCHRGRMIRLRAVARQSSFHDLAFAR